MSRTTVTGVQPAHCYTNPSFCRQSEYITDNRVAGSDELLLPLPPPPPQFQSSDDLPPPSPSPPPPPPLSAQQQQQQQQQQHNHVTYDAGHANPAFQFDRASRSERINVPRSPSVRYGYLDERRPVRAQDAEDAYIAQANERRRVAQGREIRSRYEYIDGDEDDDDDNDVAAKVDDATLRRNGSSRTGSARYAYVENATTSNVHVQQQQQQQQQQRQEHQQGIHRVDTVPGVFSYQRREQTARYALVPVAAADDESTTGGRDHSWAAPPTRNCRTPLVLCERSNSTRGRYARVPSDEILDGPAIPSERNIREQRILQPDEIHCVSPKNNVATQKLHEILTTPRKPRSRSEERTLSPSKRQHIVGGIVPRSVITPTGSPSGRYASSPSRAATAAAVGTPSGRRGDQHQLVQVSTPHRGDLSPGGGGGGGGGGETRPHTSTPNKEPSARRCLPLNLDNSTASRVRDSRAESSCPASNCGRLRYPQRSASAQRTDNPSTYGHVGSPGEPPPRYAYLDGLSESIPMVTGSPRYQVVVATANDEKSVESAFIARTAVVPPLSPPNSEANTTLASGLEKNERRNAPLLLLLVGILTCGLALYLSWSQGRRYYLDSAAGCGACCALAGACRSLRRTWTGLGLAGLSALSCAGLLLIAAKAPRAGTPLHDVTAGALCGVSLLGAALALLALLSPKCKIARHRRVHSWIPRFSQSSSSSY